MTNVNTDDPETDALVRAYLDRLRAAAWNLPPERRDELLAEVREHIDAALAADPQGGPEVAARNVLDRLGPPEEIVRAESEGTPYAGAAGDRRAPAGQPVGRAGDRRGGHPGGRRHRAARSSARWSGWCWPGRRPGGRRPQKPVASVLALLPVLLVVPVVLAGP